MKKLSMIPMLAGLALFVASCSSVAHIEKDQTVNFNNYKTFTWIENDKESKQFLNDIQASNLQTAVSTELIKANWQESTTRPDVILKHEVMVEKTVRESRDPVYSRPHTNTLYNPYTRRYVNVYYPSRFLGYEENQYQANEGKITITMVDAKTDKVIWQGWTTEQINKDITTKDIKSGVKSIFKKFDEEKK
ncbi:MAG: DUF4136 domain-containing protein [Ferruginibacter sp.]